MRGTGRGQKEKEQEARRMPKGVGVGGGNDILGAALVSRKIAEYQVLYLG